jgi:hypothetical protein
MLDPKPQIPTWNTTPEALNPEPSTLKQVAFTYYAAPSIVASTMDALGIQVAVCVYMYIYIYAYIFV